MTKEINADTWDREMASAGEKPVVVDFWHEQCVWCQRLNPIYEELSSEYDKAIFAKLNVRAGQDNIQVAQRYGVMGTPTMKVFCEGREVGEIVGFMEKKSLRHELDNIVAHAEQCLEQSEPAA